MSAEEQVASESRKAREKRDYNRTGLAALRSRVKVRGLHALDTRTAGAQALLAWRSELINDLGGEKAISAQARAIVEIATRTRLFLDHVDAWLMEQPSLVFIKKKTVHPVLLQRQQFADALARYLDQLGLDKRHPPAPDLRDFLQRKTAERPRTVDQWKPHAQSRNRNRHPPRKEFRHLKVHMELMSPMRCRRRRTSVSRPVLKVHRIL